jgi:uncharacterized protein (DUF427 family)
MTTPVESVWDYPRPPRLEPCDSLVRVVHAGVVLCETRRSLRLLETSHPPTFYLPPDDCAQEHLRAIAGKSSFCEYKGVAKYWTLDLPGVGPVAVAWSYPSPTPEYARLKDHLAFYASRVGECTVDGERAVAQPGDFYGGWITSRVKGPFKGGAGTMGW